MPQDEPPKQDAAHGVGGTTDEVPISGAEKTAPLPEGMSEMNDRTLSAGTDQSGSGHGGNGPNTMGENKGLGAVGKGKTNA